MFKTKCKMRFLTFFGILALPMLILPMAAYARGRDDGGGGRVMASSNRSQMSAPAQRSAPSVRMDSIPSAPQRNINFGNFRGSERPNTNREFSAPVVSNRQTNIESRVANVQRFNFDFNARPSQVTSNDNRPIRQNFNNRVWARNEPAPVRVDNRLSDSSVAHAGKIISPQNPPTPPAERLVNPGTMRSDIGDRVRNDSGMWRRANPQINTENNRTAVTRTNDSGWHRGDNRTAIFNRDTHSQTASRWNRDRDNVSLRVVNNVPSAVTTQRNKFSRGSTDFFGRGDHHGRFIDIPRNDFAFFGRHHHFIHHRIIDHDFFFLAFSDFGPWCTYYPVYPYYHRSYIFVNPCGYWPYDYSYMRYYWYGCYPYYWYGYNPVPYEYGTDTTNYYTYNYYGTDTTGPAPAPAISDMSNYTPQQPAPATSADQYFDDGVKAFGNDDFKTAVTKFALANQMTTNDKVLPFAYSQAFLATGDYKSAAQVLRAAVGKVNPVAEGVFYPRGLYSSDDVLLKQIDELSTAANQNPQDFDLQLLTGYQYLGLGELDKADEPLRNASMDSMNGPTANALLQLLDKLQATAEQENAKAPPATPAMETPAESK